MELVHDKKANTVTVKLQLAKIKFNRERRVYYYDGDVMKMLQEQGFKPVRCIKSCVVDNVKNTSGEWVFELEPKFIKIEQIVTTPVVEIEEEKPKPKRRRRTTRKPKTEE